MPGRCGTAVAEALPGAAACWGGAPPGRRRAGARVEGGGAAFATWGGGGGAGVGVSPCGRLGIDGLCSDDSAGGASLPRTGGFRCCVLLAVGLVGVG